MTLPVVRGRFGSGRVALDQPLYQCAQEKNITSLIANRPIFNLRQRGVRKHSSSPRQFRWDQTFSLKEARASAAAKANVASDDEEEEDLVDI